MSAQAAITLDTVVYSPNGVIGTLAEWINRGSGIANQFSRLTASLIPPSKDGKVYRASFKLVVPVVAAADTSCVCAGDILRSGQISVDFLLPLNSTTVERQHLYDALKGVGNNTANLLDYVVSLLPAT